SFNIVVTVHAAVKDFEEVDVLGERRKLLRVETTSDKVKGPNGELVPLPKATFWLGEDLTRVCSSTEIPSLGTLKTYRTTKAAALAPGTAAKAGVDIGLNSQIPLNKAVPSPSRVAAVVYRITIDDDDPTTTFAQDVRQEVRNVRGKSFELRVQAVRRPSPDVKPETIRDEFRTSSYYVNCDDAKIKDLARKAV